MVPKIVRYVKGAVLTINLSLGVDVIDKHGSEPSL